MSKWEMVKLGDVCTTTQGVQIPLSEQINSLKYGYMRYLYIGDFKGTNKNLYVQDIYGSKLVTNEDLVMANTGSPGAVFRGINGILSNNLFKISFDKVILDRDFLYLFLSSTMFQTQLQQKMKGGIQRHLGHKTISEQEIPLPPLETQKQIAQTLDTTAELLGMRKQQLAELDNLIKSTFYDMFGDPVTNPRKWELVMLGNLGQLNSGGTPTRTNPKYFLGDIDWYSAGELNERYLKGSKEKLTEEALTNSAAKVFKKGSMLIGMYDTAAFKLGILISDSSSNQACANIYVEKDKVNIEWLYDCAQIMRSFFLKNRRGVRQKNLNLGMIRSFEVPLPPLILQTQFAEIVTKIEEQKALTQKAIDETQYLFDSLMSEYFE